MVQNSARIRIGALPASTIANSLLGLAFLFTATSPCHASSVATSVVDAQGTSAPCVGLPNVVSKCLQLTTQAGLIESKDLGVSGLTFQTTGANDGLIATVNPGSAADLAGLHVGDRIVAVNGTPVQPTPGAIAVELSFGERGQSVKIKVTRAGTPIEVTYLRDAKNAPPGPTVKGFMYSLKPIVNWKGQFVPCLGAGPAGITAIEYCQSHFRKDGYIKASNYGSTGLEIDTSSPDSAKILSVDSGSAAEKAGLQAGDQIVAVNGQPLQVSLGEVANEMLFGKIGTQFQLTVLSGGTQKPVQLTLAGK